MQGFAHESRWIAALAAFAALRVLASASLFPLFSNVDETSHYDVVSKYARGHVPRGLEPFSPDFVRLAARVSSPEFMIEPEKYGGRYPDPPDGAKLALRVTALLRWAQGNASKESGEPPLYYALAAVWLRLGEALGLSPVTLPYWVRWLGAVSAALCVWLGHVTARSVFPGSALQRLGVPFLLAVFPQDTFYAIAPDMLSPLLVGVAYLGWIRFDPAKPAAATATGLALGGAALVKAANLPLIGVTVAAALLRARPAGKVTRANLVLVASAALPIAAWMTWNHFLHGDWTGTSEKIASLGWTRKSLFDWWPHPLFTLSGLHTFWSELAASFWRGELAWHGVRLTLPAMDVFYWVSSTLLPLVALVRPPERREARDALWLAAALFASGVVFQAVLSLAFDFGACLYPSRAVPLFTSGRLVTGALVPFLLLYVHGLDRALAFSTSDSLRWAALLAIAAAVTGSEVWLDLGPAASAYNLFHFGG